jgi:suppressor for copper-sensitivity B
MQKLLNIFILFFLTINQAFGAVSPIQKHDLSEAQISLLGSFYQIDNQKKLIVGVKFNLAPGWKIYGNDDSGMGMPPQLDFSQSTNYKSHQISFPTALIAEEKIGNQSIKYSYYKDTVIIPANIELTDLNRAVDLKLKLDFAICKDVCIPISQNFSLTIDNIDENSLQEIQNFYPTKLIENKIKDSNDFSKIDISTGIKKTPKNDFHKLFIMIFLAIMGGMILNIMPCVLPVISIKLMSILKHSGSSSSAIRYSFFATIIGILTCFFILGFITFFIQNIGTNLGWGFQFQNPYFLIFLILILAIFTAELFGMFEINFSQIIATFLNLKISENVAKKNIFLPNFLSGILAVLLATPCSAPFLGTAISFAVSQNFAIIILIFIFIGIGFSLPYIILIISPKLINFLPKPGSWMIKIKQLMAGFLLATMVWLVFVLSNIIGLLPSLLLSIIALLIFLSFKIKKFFLRTFVLASLGILAFILPIEFHSHQSKIKNEINSYWIGFDENILNNLIAQNKIILVDVTADWCLTCKFNKILVLNSPEIIELLKTQKVIGLRADITKPDPEVMKFLAKHNRFAIPFNAVYGPNARQGLLTSEFLNKNELLSIINNVQ